MPAISSLSINDGQVSPVAHTFAVGSTNGQEAYWLEKSAGSSLGYYKLTYRANSAKSPSAADTVEVQLSLPTLSTADDVISQARRSSASLRFNFAQSATDQERKDLVAYVTNFLANSTVKAAASAIEPFY
jgi:hypothetical protein